MSSGWYLPVPGSCHFPSSAFALRLCCLECLAPNIPGVSTFTAQYPTPTRADTPKTLLALSTPSTQTLSSGSSRRVTFCLYRNTSGAYLLSPNRTQVCSSRLTSTNLISPHLEGGGGDFLFNEETQAWRRQGICSRSQWESLRSHPAKCFNALSELHKSPLKRVLLAL